MDVRTVTVELLRAGTRHNQLISPLTQYLGVCGNAPAGRVTLPYEHGDLERRLQNLRYGVIAEGDPGLSSKTLDQIGREMADILATIPGVPGMLNPEEERPQTLTHLRIVLSASELAMLPFEASKVPTGAGSSSVWLALQARTPVCITRHIRSVSAERIRWANHPRVLFVAGPDTPVEEHEQALLAAMAPWRGGKNFAHDPLVVLKEAKLADISREIAAAAAKGAPFTHVHILAHGASLEDGDRYSPMGVALHDEKAISGRRLATTLTSLADGGVTVPVVVTLASCDSGKISDVRTTDASVAHDLHDQGIPLVVASQFPLSVEGSVCFIERFYQRLLWGEHPLVALYEVRLQMHSRLGPDTHDWASLVVYEALPADLLDQLEDFTYWQARRAHEGELECLENLMRQTGGEPLPVTADLHSLYQCRIQDVEAMAARLPRRGSYALECAGLRGGGQKRMAQVAFKLATTPGTSAESTEKLLAVSLRRLEEARTEYWRATKSFLSSWAKPGRKKANLHWLLGQVMSLDVVLGRPLDGTLLAAARLAAEIDQEAPQEEERAWAYVSLTEFALLRLADPTLPAAERSRCAEESITNAGRFLGLLGPGSEHVLTTARQFERYADWWGNPDLRWAIANLGIPERPHWNEEHGLVPTAKKVVALLRSSCQSIASMEGLQKARPTQVPLNSATSGETAQPSKASARLAATGEQSVSTPRSTFTIEMLPAANGDCLWIEYGDPNRPRRVLIDCGAKSAARTIASRIKAIEPPNGREFELFVLTHIDADHIDGVLPLFEASDFDSHFDDIWFNGWQQINRFLSVKQGEEFSKLLADPRRSLPWNRVLTGKADKTPAPIVIPKDAPPPTFQLPGGLRLTLLSPGADQLKRLAQNWKKVLSDLKPGKKMLARRQPPPRVTDFAAFDLASLAKTPTEKDPSVANGSSIALLAEFDGRAILLTGDAHADVLVKSMKALQRARGHSTEKLKLDALKLSHHGSANGTTMELLEAIDCPRYLVSSSGNIFYHPDREAIARVIVHGGANPTLFFNYRNELNCLWDNPSLKERYGYSAVYPPKDKKGLRVELT